MATEQNGKAVTTTEVMPPVPITVIGTGEGLVSGTKATTPPDQPNLVVNVVQPVIALLVRAVNVYVGSLVGLLAAAIPTNAIPAPDFGHLLLKCAGLAVAGTVVLMLKDIVTITAKLEQKFPLLTGSV
jgi:hypothetical protein